MMKKKSYHTTKRRDHSKNKEYVRLCYKCKSPNYIVADCLYNSDNEENEKKKNKKEKKEKKKKKMTFKKNKKGGSNVVIWDSDASSNDDDSSDDDNASKNKAPLTSIAINNKSPLFDTSSCFMAKSSKIKYDESGDSECESDSDDDNEFSYKQLMDMLEQS
jgi:hypothetical protein